MTRHPCTAPHAFGRAQSAPEPDTHTADDAADLAIMAAAEFEPWDRSMRAVPSNQQWIASTETHLITLRLGFVTCCRSKSELISVVENMAEQPGDGDESMLEELLRSLRETQGMLESLSLIASTAEARLFSAASVLAERENAAA